MQMKSKEIEISMQVFLNNKKKLDGIAAWREIGENIVQIRILWPPKESIIEFLKSIGYEKV